MGRNATEPYSYARQKLWEAIQALVSSRPMRRRLADALSALALLNAEHDIPPSKRATFKQLKKDLERRIDNSNPYWRRIKTTAPKSDKFANEILDQFVEVMGGL
jgi:hypothetical protein